MARLRLLRILLPGLLILLAFLLYYSWVPRNAPHSEAVSRESDAPHVVNFEFVEVEGGRRTVAGDVEHFEQRDDGGLHLEGIHDLTIDREGRGPLLISASRGDREGAAGERVWKFDGEVVFRDSDRGLRLALPSLELDEIAQVARSSGDIRFEAPGIRGRAAALVYGLQGETGHLDRPVLEDEQGGRLIGERARLLDGVRDIELVGDVRALRGGERLDAGRVRLWRDEDDRLRRSLAGDGVWGSWPVAGGAPAQLRSDELEVEWGAAGELASVDMRGDALVRRDAQTLSARNIRADRDESGDGWTVHASESVFVQGMFGAAPGLLQTELLDATLDAAFALESASATGGVSFEGGDTRAEAERATWTALAPGSGEIRLFAEAPRKARLSYGQTRVAAERIVTDPRGSSLVAEGRVEASLLPGAAAGDGPRPLRLFVAGEAVHFVSTRLESGAAGERLVFTGDVRGWQGERNLAAEQIVVDQVTNSLEAEDNVATRMPRMPQALAISEADYIQISATRLDYDDAEGRAIYTGDVRLELAEGWLEAERVEVTLAAQSRELSEVRAYGDVRLEFHRTSEDELAQPISGGADRVAYDPASEIVRLYGDEAPAFVRRIGDGGGTTTGRVLAYRLDSGTLDVDSGERGPATIRTAGG